MLFPMLGNNIRLLFRRGGRHRFMLEEAQDDDGMSSCGHDDDMSALEGDPRAALMWATARLFEVREITWTPSLMIMLLMRIRASTLPPWTRIPMSRLYQFAALVPIPANVESIFLILATQLSAHEVRQYWYCVRRTCLHVGLPVPRRCAVQRQAQAVVCRIGSISSGS